MAIKLHLIAFDIPWPPDYGGVIDVYYKVKYLAAAGVKIYLHCSQYAGRKPAPELAQLCERVWYYPRPSDWKNLDFRTPYMVYSRRNDELLHTLQQYDFPVFFDGTNASYYLSHPSLKKRIRIFRPHNVEAEYYQLLSIREKHWLKKAYYYTESLLLKNYEKKLGDANAFFAIAEHDYYFYQNRFPDSHHAWIPAFHPFDKVVSATGTGAYAIYHGNMAHAENKEAVLFLLEQVIPFINTPFIIAGRNPDSTIRRLAAALPHCRVVANPTGEEMDRLIHEAHIQVLPTFQHTGLKLKLLHALFNGRHVLVNDIMLRGTGLSAAGVVADTPESFREQINVLMKTAFTETDRQSRQEMLSVHYDNSRNAAKIIAYLKTQPL